MKHVGNDDVDDVDFVRRQQILKGADVFEIKLVREISGRFWISGGRKNLKIKTVVTLTKRYS